MPGRRHERSQAEAGADHHDAEQHDGSRPAPVDQPAENRAENPRDQEPEREGAGGEPAPPPELVEDRRKQKREHRARVDADAYRDEGDGDDDPAVEGFWWCELQAVAGLGPRRPRRAEEEFSDGAAHASQVILLYDPLCRSV